jgi:mono/diheme cytochrome c family protein
MVTAFLASALAADPERGRLLTGLGGCQACHTADDGEPWAGGHAIETRFGTFYGTNLTPDPEHGLGAWTDEDFVRAMRRGRSPDGRAYWPAFPYASFTRLTDADLADLWAFLRTLPAVSRPDTAQEPRPSRLGLSTWRLLFFSAREWEPLDDPVLDRGAYLGEVVGHCGECHTPRSSLGRPKRREALAGSEGPPYDSPDIRAEALADWSDADLLELFTSGMEPDGDFVGAGMRHVIRQGTRYLPEEDRLALVAWLRVTPRGRSAATSRPPRTSPGDPPHPG